MRICNIMMLFYFFINPLFQIPPWCVAEYEDQYFTRFLFDCGSVKGPDGGSIALFTDYKLSNIYHCVCEMICLSYFWYLLRRRKEWRTVTRAYEYRVFLMIGMWSIALIDCFICLVRKNSPWVQNIMRPGVVLVLYENSRNHFKSIINLAKDSSVIIGAIYVFVVIYSFLGYFIFRDSLEGYSFFMTPGISFYELFITFTTSNFPNVMLPAYSESRFACLYFILFLLLGLYFLQNVLLATVFDNYKNAVQEEYDSKFHRRKEALVSIFDTYDQGKKGYHTREESK